MRYKYINEKTGAEFESNCEISAPNFIKLGAETPAPKPLPVPEAKAEVKAEPKPKTTKTKSAKSTTKKGAKK